MLTFIKVKENGGRQGRIQDFLEGVAVYKHIAQKCTFFLRKKSIDVVDESIVTSFVGNKFKFANDDVRDVGEDGTDRASFN